MLFPLHFVKAGTCTWVNPYDGDETRTVTPRVLPNVGKDGNVQYESCDQAIKRDRRAVQKRYANRHANKHITGGSRNNCFWKELLPPFTEHKVEVRQVGENPDGTPKYESCRTAQKRKQEAWRKSEGWEHKEDLEDAIKKHNEKEDERILSSEKTLKNTSNSQQLVSTLTKAGGVLYGLKGAKCLSQCGGVSSGCCHRAPVFLALSAGLFKVSNKYNDVSNQNREIARQYAGSLLNDPNNPGSSGTPGGPNNPGNITGGATSGLPTSPPITPPRRPPVKITMPNGDEVTLTPGNIKDYFKKHNLDFDLEKSKVTLPDGRSYTAEDMEKPEFRQFANSKAAADLKKQMKDLEKQITDQMDDGTIDSLAADDSEEEGGLGGAGGGGFGGYDGGPGFDDGEGGGTLIAGMGGGGSRGKDADKNSKVAGMSVQAGKNRVGVAQDDIFEMIHRRYQNKRKKQQFIEISF
ncbi:MAG: hypothetical protein OXM55_05780 [Bdellovibrionales bacterium]|nr:hypothetical protein [Bdellovibrionales bacterium]